MLIWSRTIIRKEISSKFGTKPWEKTWLDHNSVQSLREVEDRSSMDWCQYLYDLKGDYFILDDQRTIVQGLEFCLLS